MPTKNSIRGTVLENETVKDAEAYGLETRRAPCSKGSMLGNGYHDQIDILIEKYTIQCKRMKKPPSKVFLELLPETHNTDVVVFRFDGKPRRPIAVMDLDLYLRLIKLEKSHA